MRMRWLLADGAILASLGPITQAPRNACSHFLRAPHAFKTRGYLGVQLVFTHWFLKASGAEVRNTGITSYPSATCGGGQLGLKPHEIQHLAPEAASPIAGLVSINTAQMAPQSFSGLALPL